MIGRSGPTVDRDHFSVERVSHRQKSQVRLQLEHAGISLSKDGRPEHRRSDESREYPFSRLAIRRDQRVRPIPGDGTGVGQRLENGVSVIAGINGLGKTTVLNAFLPLLIGPWDVLRENPEDVGSTQHTLIPWRNPLYFSARVPDGAASATIAGQISFGEEAIYVVRSQEICHSSNCVEGSRRSRRPTQSICD